MESNEDKIGTRHVEQWLDAALRARVDAEPRVGLQERVLARIANEPQRARFQWWPVMSGVAAILLIAVALVLLPPSRPRPNIRIRSQDPVRHSTPADAQQRPSVLAVNRPEGQKHRAHVASRDAACCVSSETVESTARPGSERARQKLPMLATLPAARPETEEEHLLARLAAQGKTIKFAQLQDRPLPQFTIHALEETLPQDNPQD